MYLHDLQDQHSNVLRKFFLKVTHVCVTVHMRYLQEKIAGIWIMIIVASLAFGPNTFCTFDKSMIAKVKLNMLLLNYILVKKRISQL